MPSIKSVSASLSTVTASPLTIANDGVQSSVVTLALKWSDGTAAIGVPAASCVLAVSGAGNTVTQPTGFTDANGEIAGSAVSVTAATKTASFTIAGLAVTDTASLVVSSDLTTLGPGPNAPAWSGKTVYDEELFDSAIAVHPDGVNGPSGFRGYTGFPGYYDIPYEYDYVTYPSAVTPIGTKTVLQVNFPGSRTTIDAVSEVSTTWLIAVVGCSVMVTGTWVGTLSFEVSTDGGSNWSAQTLDGYHGGATGSSTTANGAWMLETVSEVPSRIFRVRASAWTSGSATVDVGIRGGYEPASMIAGSFTGSPTRIYTRYLMKVDAAWTDNGNAGTKNTFFSQIEGNNHFLNLTDAITDSIIPGVQLQQTSSYAASGAGTAANYGDWFDVEVILQTGTAGSANGVAQVWIDGVQQINVSNVPFFAAATTPRWTQLDLVPTYGGGRRPPPATLYFQIAGWYRESAA